MESDTSSRGLASSGGEGLQSGLGGRGGTWLQALPGALALLVPGLALALHASLLAPWSQMLFFGSYLFILVGLLAGWVQGFPRWAYPYLGYGLVFAVWLANVSSPGLSLLGYTFGRNEVWGGRAWLGLAAVAVLALLWTRSLRPLARLVSGIWQDGTRLSFALYGSLPFVLWLLFDEVHPPYPVPFLAVSSLCLAGGGAAYLRSDAARRRLLSLLTGLSAGWAVSTVALAAYWHGPRVPGHAPFHWSKTVLPMVLAWLVVTALLLLPALLGLLHRVVPARRPA